MSLSTDCTEESNYVSLIQIKLYLWIELQTVIEDNFSILAVRLLSFQWQEVKDLYFLFGRGFVSISPWSSNKFSEKKE